MLLDRKKEWLDKIWLEIHTLLASDAYSRLWLKAQEAAGIPYGPIARTIISQYVSYQLAAIRRICDRRKQDDVISLPKLLDMIKGDKPDAENGIDSLMARLKEATDPLYALATQYVSHNADPLTTKNWKAWSLTSAQLTATHKAMCKVALAIERDLLQLTFRTHLIPVYQGDVLDEVRRYVPEDHLDELRQFWHEHNDSVNGWARLRWSNA
jgi:hypothetical protein